MMNGLGAMIRRRRSSPSNAVATVSGFVVAERHRQQPFVDLLTLRRRVGEAQGCAQRAELLVAGLEPGGVGGEHLSSSVKLVGDETQRRLRNDLARSQHPPGIAQRTASWREAELVVNAATPVDEEQIIVAQGQVPHRSASVAGKASRTLELRFGERASLRHGGLSQLR